LIFEQLNPSACRTYLVADERSREAILIDPVLEGAEGYLNKIHEGGFDLRYTLDTHTHADHISGSPAVKDLAGVDFVMYKFSPMRCVNFRVDETDALTVGSITMRFLYTPGHTVDSVTLVFEDKILTGDTLFIGRGGAGRTDLPGGDSARHYESLRKLALLDDRLVVYPAHDYYGQTSSTLAIEKSTNERLRFTSKDEYVAWLKSLSDRAPDWMMEVLKTNYNCAQDPRLPWVPIDHVSSSAPCISPGGGVNVHDVRRVEIKDALDLMKRKNCVVIDVREPSEYDGPLGHIEGSTLLPLGQLAKRIKELESLKGRTVITTCRTGPRSDTAASLLKLAGFSDVYSLQGGMEAWKKYHSADRSS